MYREELTQAKKRIEELDEQLGAQKAEIAELRAKFERRLSSDPALPAVRRRRWIPAAVGCVMLLGGVGGWIWTRGGRPDAHVVVNTESPPQDRETPTLPGPRTQGRSSDPGFRLDIPSEQRVLTLAGRCERGERAFDALPHGTKVMDFLLCSDCACCLPGGEFPPAFDDRHKFVKSTGDCRACSRDAQLAAAGITAVGGTDSDPLRGTQGLILRLANPARVVGLRIAGGGFSHPARPDYVVGMVAYDPDGRPVDAVRVSYPASRDDAAVLPDFSLQQKDMVVKACKGETIGRIDLKGSDLNVRVKAIALLPADGT